MTLPRGAADGGEPAPDPAGPAPSYAEQDDRTLVRLVCVSDAAALEALYGRYGRACYGLARRILTDEQLAQDVVQEVFLAVWRDASRFDASRGGFSTWLLSMTHHKAVDSVRREENLRKRRTSADVLETTESEAPKVDEAVWSLVRRERVREALKTLPGPQREALALAYFGGYTQREIAGLTATPLGTVKTRMLVGMRRMKESLDGLSNAAGGFEPPGGWTSATDPRGST
jgi:RNA polymerase sigma-70 factor (ECF subfamily)